MENVFEFLFPVEPDTFYGVFGRIHTVLPDGNYSHCGATALKLYNRAGFKVCFPHFLFLPRWLRRERIFAPRLAGGWVYVALRRVVVHLGVVGRRPSVRLAVGSLFGNSAADSGGALREAGGGDREDEHGQYQFHGLLSGT